MGAEYDMIAVEECAERAARSTVILQEVKPDNPGIYFISTEDGLFTKIGWVKYSQWADLRLEQLQIGNPVALLIEMVVSPGRISQERKLHRRFAQYMSRGEWFRREGELRMILDASRENKESAVAYVQSIIDPD